MTSLVNNCGQFSVHVGFSTRTNTAGSSLLVLRVSGLRQTYLVEVLGCGWKLKDSRVYLKKCLPQNSHSIVIEGTGTK